MAKIILLSIVAFALTTTAFSLQQDSLYDVFPLSIGNQWSYQYHYDYYFYKPGAIWIVDSGTVDLQVIDKIPANDTLIWQLNEHRTYQHHYRAEIGPVDTTYEVDTTLTITLYESQLGQHLLTSDCNSSAFYFGCSDTASAYRYKLIDTNGNSFVDYNYSTIYVHHTAFHRNEGLTLDSLYAAGGSISTRYVRLYNSVLGSVDKLMQAFPEKFGLRQNFPNPFNPSRMIAYDLPRQSHVQLSVFDVLGRKIATLVDHVQESGSHQVRFDASHLSSGIYFYELRAGGISLHRKMVLLR